MIYYILKRCAQMIPTVGGVILITFILFNIVGGSPASMTLGQHVSPKALEEFDEQRGFNKPLLFGRWTRTRALEDTVFEKSIGPWRQVHDAAFTAADDKGPGRLVLSTVGGSLAELGQAASPLRHSATRWRAGGKGDADYPVPLAFGLRPNTRYQLIITYRLADGASAVFWKKEASSVNEAFVISESQLIPLPFSRKWKTISLPFRAGAGSLSLTFQVKGQALEIRSVKLRRRMSHPFDTQLVFYLKQIARLDFGMSSSMNQPVSRLLLQGVLPSLVLTFPILVVELIVSIVIALLCAFFRNTLLDRGFVVCSVALMSINYLVWIVAGQYLLAYRLHWFPIWGFDSWRYLLLPVLIGVVSGLGVNVRFYRAIMLDEMYREYVRTAFAKGVSRSGVLFKHVLKNAMIPIITNVVIALPFLYTGSLLLESFFGIPGLGYLSVNGLNSADVDVVRAVVLIGSVLFVVANLITDICYALVDPRVKLT